MKTKKKKALPEDPAHPTPASSIFTPADIKRLKPLLSKESFDQLIRLTEGDPMPEPMIDSDGNEIDYCNMDAISIKHWSDGEEQHIYQIGNRVYAYYDDRGDFLIYIEPDVTSVIQRAYDDDRDSGYFEEKCVAFEVKPPLRFAKRGHDGDCCVWINTFFRDDHVRSGDHSGWARYDDHKIIHFESYSDARKWINQDKKEHHGYADIQYPKGHYNYAHNEYAPREYRICK